MKRLKIKLITLPLLIIFLMAGCSSEKKESNERIIAVSSISIISDMVKEIGGDKVESVSICAIGTDPHTYQSVPGDSRTISKADIVFKNGLGLEGWIDRLISAAAASTPLIRVTEGITPITDEQGHGDPDPHCWFDAELAKVYIDNILQGLIKVDPANKDFYEDNAERYKKDLDSLHEWTRDVVNSIPDNNKILVTSHDAFRYFGRAYGIRVIGLQGISTEAKVQTADVAKMIDLIKNYKLPAVFVETTVNPKLLEQVTKETGAVIGGTLYSDSIGEENSEGNSFIKAFTFNVNTIVKGLRGQ
jgi:ABC-type Zn uptake system ZnuABC Zn-binding protein ZnuA